MPNRWGPPIAGSTQRYSGSHTEEHEWLNVSTSLLTTLEVEQAAPQVHPMGLSGDEQMHREIPPFLALHAWPQGTRTHLDSVGVTAESISLRGQARSAEDYQRVIDGLSALPGWRIGSPQFREAKDGYAFTAELAPTPAPGSEDKGAQRPGSAP